MFTGFLLFMNCYRSNKKLNILSFIFLLVYCLFNFDYKTNLVFNIFNLSLILVLSILIKLSKGKLNIILSVFSILIYSVLIDVICFYLFPLFDMNMNLLEYIWSGLCFNWKQILIPSIIGSLIIVLDKVGNYENMSNRC